MKKRLIYVPVERYKSRWTEFVSGPDGMFEKQCKDLGVEVVPIRPEPLQLFELNTGVAVDIGIRTWWGFRQIAILIEMLESGDLNYVTDTIYFEDFWTPGFEMMPYAMDILEKPVPMYAFCHAQSVDPYDFTYPMRWWMRDLEKGWAKYLQGIFVAAPELKEMLQDASISPQRGISAVGTVFDSSVLKDKFSVPRPGPRQKMVIFSSRWDTEKCPDFFMDLAVAVDKEKDDVVFAVCSGRELCSNDPDLVKRARRLQDDGTLLIFEDLDKSAYYSMLSNAMVQFNCADQDFVSYTLLEAATFGCTPLYPNYLTFPAALHRHPRLLYEKGNLMDAKSKLYDLLNVLEGPGSPDLGWIYRKYERSVNRMLRMMGFDVPEVKSLGQELHSVGV